VIYFTPDKGWSCCSRRRQSTNCGKAY